MGNSILAVLPGMWARGAEICTLNLLTGLKALGYRTGFHAALRQALPADMELHLLPRLEKVARVTYGIHGDGNDAILSSAVYGFKPDILLYAFDKSIAAQGTNAKKVLVVHGIAKNDFAGYHHEYTDAVVCVSKCGAAGASSYGIPKRKIWVIENGVPLASGQNRREEWGIPEKAWAWCFVGGLNELKRPHLLIAALARRAREDEYAVFAGYIDPGLMYKEYAEALGAKDRCIFLGHTNNVEDVYLSSDCLVITSERESMPLVMLEAMSAWRPVVANGVGGIPEVLGMQGSKASKRAGGREKERFGVMFTDESGEAGFDQALDAIRTPQFVSAPMWAHDRWLKNHTLEIMAERYDGLFESLLGV